MTVDFTVLTNPDPDRAIVKQHCLDENGNYVQKSAPEASRADGEIHQLEDLNEFRYLLSLLNESHCLILGVPNCLLPTDNDKFKMVPSGFLRQEFLRLDWEDKTTKPIGRYEIDGVAHLARVKENFNLSNILMFDFDPDPSTNPPHTLYHTEQEYLDALCSVFPEMADAACVIKHSASANLLLPNGTWINHQSPKRHVYFQVQDVQDISRFQDVLRKRMWLAGLGWHTQSAGGARLKRSIYDDSVIGSPERIVYDGKAILRDGIKQYNPAPVFKQGKVLDTRLLKDLSEEDELKYANLTGAETKRRQVLKGGKMTFQKYAKDVDRVYDLALDTTVVLEDKHTRMTVEQFLNKGTPEQYCHSPFRWGNFTSSSWRGHHRGPSAKLIRTRGNSCILFDHNDRVTHSFPRTPFVPDSSSEEEQEAIEGQEEKDLGEIIIDHTMELLEDLQRELGTRDVVILYGPEGQRKSQFADRLAEEGRAVAFACQSNEQARIQHEKSRQQGSVLYVSKAFKLWRNTGIEAVIEEDVVPWGDSKVDEQATFQRMVDSGKFKTLRGARAYWKNLTGAQIALQPKRKHFLTQERLKILARGFSTKDGEKRPGIFDKMMYLEPIVEIKHVDTDEGPQQVEVKRKSKPAEKRMVLYFDDPPASEFIGMTRVTDANRHLLSEKDEQGRLLNDDAVIQGIHYLMRPRNRAFDYHVDRAVIVVTTSEFITATLARNYFERQNAGKPISEQRKIHFVDLTLNQDSSQDFKDPQTNAVLIGSKYTRKKYHGVFGLLGEMLGEAAYLIGDGIGLEESIPKIKGRNDMDDRDIVIKLSQPSQEEIEDTGVALGIDVTDRKSANYRELAALIMSDKANQAIGRNQGRRYDKAENFSSTVVVDRSYLKAIEESVRYVFLLQGQLEALRQQIRLTAGTTKEVLGFLLAIESLAKEGELDGLKMPNARMQTAYEASVDYIKREREHKRQALRERIRDKVEELDREGQAATWNRVDKALHLLQRHQNLAGKEELREWVEEAKQHQILEKERQTAPFPYY